MRLLAFVLALFATDALADPVPYMLDTDRSDVGFSYDFQGSERKGSMPVKSAEMLIDLENVPASSVVVELEARKAKAGFIFATQVMKGPDVLDTASYPVIRFASTSFDGDLRGATVSGDLTIRGVTRPVTLEAGLFRQRGTEIGDTRNLTVLLTGTINRNDFGASGFPGYVGPMIDLRIIARINR